MTWIRFDLLGLLFGDILAISKQDIALIYGGGALVLGVLAWIWKPLFAVTVSPELAKAEGIQGDRANLIFMLLLALLIAIAMKITGVLLITALLIIPASTARRFASGPEQMALIATLCGGLAVLGGLFGSLEFDTPSGPSIVVAALALFVLSLSPLAKLLPNVAKT